MWHRLAVTIGLLATLSLLSSALRAREPDPNHGVMLTRFPLRLQAQSSTSGGDAVLGANNTFSGNNTFTGTNTFIAPGVFTSTQQNDFLSVILTGGTSCSPALEEAGVGNMTEPIVGCANIPTGATVLETNAVSGVVVNNQSGGTTAAVGVFGLAHAKAGANNSRNWGGNFVVGDVSTITGTALFSTELDCNVNNVSNVCYGAFINGNWSAQPTNSYAILIAQPGGGGFNWPYGVRFQIGATPAPSANGAGIFFNPVASGTNQASQGMTFLSNDAVSGQNEVDVQELASGNLLFTSIKANTGVVGRMLTASAGNVPATGAITGDATFARSSTTGVAYLGTDGSGYIFRNASNSMQFGGMANLLPQSAGGTDIGSAALPMGNLWLGTAATNNFKMQPAATSQATTVSMLDPKAATAAVSWQGGIPCTNGELALSAGWGTTAAATAVVGLGWSCEWTITSSGTGQAANPTITDTLVLPVLSASIACEMRMVGGTGTATLIDQTTLSATAPVFTFGGTPVAASTYKVYRRC